MHAVLEYQYYFIRTYKLSIFPLRFFKKRTILRVVTNSSYSDYTTATIMVHSTILQYHV